MNKNSAYVIPLVLILSACASDEVIVDMKGVNEQKVSTRLSGMRGLLATSEYR